MQPRATSWLAPEASGQQAALPRLPAHTAGRGGYPAAHKKTALRCACFRCVGACVLRVALTMHTRYTHAGPQSEPARVCACVHRCVRACVLRVALTMHTRYAHAEPQSEPARVCVRACPAACVRSCIRGIHTLSLGPSLHECVCVRARGLCVCVLRSMHTLGNACVLVCVHVCYVQAV